MHWHSLPMQKSHRPHMGPLTKGMPLDIHSNYQTHSSLLFYHVDQSCGEQNQPSLQPNPPSLFTHPHPRRLVCTEPGTIPLRDNSHVDLGPGSLLCNEHLDSSRLGLILNIYVTTISGDWG